MLVRSLWFDNTKIPNTDGLEGYLQESFRIQFILYPSNTVYLIIFSRNFNSLQGPMDCNIGSCTVIYLCSFEQWVGNLLLLLFFGYLTGFVFALVRSLENQGFIHFRSSTSVKSFLFPTLSTTPPTPALTTERLLSVLSRNRIAKPSSPKSLQNSASIQTYFKHFFLLFRDRYVFHLYFLLPVFSISGTYI